MSVRVVYTTSPELTVYTQNRLATVTVVSLNCGCPRDTTLEVRGIYSTLPD